MPCSVCVFDAYGTLFDVAGATRAAAAEGAHPALGADWAAIAEDWRRKQLEYSWLRTILGAHADFWQVTADALDWAMEARGLADPALRTRLLDLYRELPAYPEVPGVLDGLKARGIAAALLSNGSPGMLADAVRSAGLTDRLDAVLSVEETGVFKPSARVYALVGNRFGCRPETVLFVSSNGWDVAGAAAFGFRTLWVNRAGAPADRLPGRPDRILSDLSTVPEIAAA